MIMIWNLHSGTKSLGLLLKNNTYYCLKQDSLVIILRGCHDGSVTIKLYDQYNLFWSVANAILNLVNIATCRAILYFEHKYSCTVLVNCQPRTQVFPLCEGRKDTGRRWSRDLLKCSRFFIINPRWGQLIFDIWMIFIVWFFSILYDCREGIQAS
jgi:hypothetical protein